MSADPQTPAPVSAAAAPASLIPGFEIEKLVGKGGMGAVYRARKLNIGKTVALKVLLPSLAEEPVHAERFEREVRSLARLSHTNLVNVLDAGRAGDFRYMVMDFVEGQNLAEVVAEHGPLPPAAVRAIASQALAALAFIHARGMVHRDLKPANFMLQPDGVLRLCDLGLVRVTGEKSELTQKLLLGTPEFISPEQARGETDLDIRSDLYSLGATLYFLATGEPPHTGGSPLQVAHKHLTERVVPVRRRRPEFDRDLARFVEHLLAREPSQRFAEPDAALRALTAPPRRIPRPLLVAAAVLVLGGGGATAWWMQREVDGTRPTSAPAVASPSPSPVAPAASPAPEVATPSGARAESAPDAAHDKTPTVGENVALRELMQQVVQLRRALAEPSTGVPEVTSQQARAMIDVLQMLDQRLDAIQARLAPGPATAPRSGR